MKDEKIMVSDEFLKQLLDVEKLKYCFECGKCTASCPMVELFPKNYNPRILLERIFLNPESVLSDEELWLCAWCYRCYRRCPQALKVPEIFLALKKIAIEKGYLQGFEKALKIIKGEIPFPSTFCWVCLHPERAKIDKTTVANFLQHITINYEHKRKTPKTREEKVAIVGSGPAGLTAAHGLIKKGYSVTVFESFPELGGMLRKCIPEYRLPKGILDAEIQRLKNLGIEFRTGTTVGKDLTFNDLLQEGYNAIFFATGAHESRKLRVKGEDLEGVIYALDFLKAVNLGTCVKLKGKVVVVGGGNGAMDAARTASRLGAKVHILYRRSKEEMPANPLKIKETEEDGVKFQFLVTLKRILGKNGRVTAIECVRMELGEPDESGRKRPIPVEGSEFLVELDTLILAIGETPNLSFLPKEVEITEKNTIAVYPFTTETNKEGIFAGGDVVSGPATVVEAIVAGKRAAESIDRYLKNKSRSGRMVKQVVGVTK